MMATSRLKQILTVKSTKSRLLSGNIVKSAFQLPDLNLASLNVPFQRFIMQEFLDITRAEEAAIIDGFTGEQLTYREVNGTTYSFSNNLRRSYGVGNGDCVAIFSPNDLYYFTAFHGIGLTRGFATTINPLYTVEEAYYQVNATRAKVIIAHPVCLEKARTVAARLKIPIISLGDPNSISNLNGGKHDSSIVSLKEMVRDKIDSIDLDSFIGGKGASGNHHFDPNTIATVPFSSGTTGLPKGVALTHRNLIANVLQGCAYEGNYLRPTETTPRGTCICPLPLYHFYGLTAALNMTTYVGGKLILMPSFDLQKFLELIQSYKVTRGFVVPPMVLALAKHPLVDEYDLSSVTTLLCGAAPLSAEVQRRCLDRVGFPVKQGYGMTEASSFIAVTPVCQDDK
jgi:acyl-CoA synthetase (AMP-forming)/AMP-acid ligase II